MTCNKGPKPDSNQGHWGYVVCALTIGQPVHSMSPFLLSCESHKYLALRSRLYLLSPFGEFVLEVHDNLGLWGSPGPAGATIAEVVLQTPTGVGTICVDTLSVAAALVRPG